MCPGGKKITEKINNHIVKYFQDYEKELESVHGIPPAEIYKYPKCREFKQVSIFLWQQSGMLDDDDNDWDNS